jgi:hypothetical protein
MTARVFLWCGHVRPPHQDRKGRGVFNAYDFSASKNDVALTIRAARALGISDREIYPFVCDEALLPPDFNERVYDATAAELRRVAQRVAARPRAEDALLFVASNHGERQGLLMTARYDELGGDEPLHLTPAVLEDCLSGFGGPQLLLLATCHSGAFLTLGARPNRLVVTACSEHDKYHVTNDDEDAHSPLLRRLLGPWCGVACGDHAPPSRLSLDEAFEAARAFEMARSDLADLKRTEPRRNGSVIWPSL